MKTKFLAVFFSMAVLASLSAPAFARGGGGHGYSRPGGSTTHVRGYTTKRGTYVAPHVKTSPDSSKVNNWSTKGNTNPYTGQPGTKDPLR